MVTGVSEGYTKVLELAGVGYRVQLKGKDLELSLGYSHPVVYNAPEGITFEVRPPEPYKGKGIHYVGEHIRRKLGKAAK